MGAHRAAGEPGTSGDPLRLDAASQHAAEGETTAGADAGDGGAARRARWLARQRAKPVKTIVTGVIGADCHIVGHRILSFALQQAGFRTVALGALTPADDFVKAAVETDADAILVSSLYGHGMLDCQGFRGLCAEAGLDDVLLYVGGNLTVGQKDAAAWAEVERAFREIGFDRVYPPNAQIHDAIGDLRRDLGMEGERRPTEDSGWRTTDGGPTEDDR